METRLKERLTGAAIVVALIVALVPEMFRGQAGAPPANTTSSGSGEGPPVRTYTIDLSNNPKSSGPLQPTSDTSASSAPVAPATPAPPAAAVSQPAPAAAPVASVAAPKPAAASSAPAPQPRISAPAPAPQRVAHVQTAASTPAPAPVPAKASAIPAGNWSVQLGLFSKRENAERMVSEAKAKGFATAITGPDPKGQFHVHVTGLTDHGAAQAMAQKLKGEGLPAAVVAP